MIYSLQMLAIHNVRAYVVYFGGMCFRRARQCSSVVQYLYNTACMSCSVCLLPVGTKQ
jgi:hypothetical protein